MGKLSIPTLNSIKQLSAVSLLVVSPLVGVSQKQPPADSPLMTMLSKGIDNTWSKEAIQKAKAKEIEARAIDSLFEVMKHTYIDYYTPESYYSPEVIRKCLHTQKTISDILLRRENMWLLWQYIEGQDDIDTIKINRIVPLNTTQKEVADLLYILEHEMFHAEHREKMEENIIAYNELPIEEMKDQLISLGLPWMKGQQDELCDFAQYIGSDYEVYARSNHMARYLNKTFWLEKYEITPEDICDLRENHIYKDYDFLQFIDWFESEIIMYIKNIVPSQ